MGVPSFSITNTVFLLFCWLAHYTFTGVDIGSYGRNGDGGIFVHSKLGKYLETHLAILEDKQLPGISSLAPHVIVGDKAFPLETYLMRPYPGSQSKGKNEKSIFNYRFFPSQKNGGKYIWSIKSEILKFIKGPYNHCRRMRTLFFATCILHNYLRDQGVGLSDMGRAANVRSNLTKIPNQG